MANHIFEIADRNFGNGRESYGNDGCSNAGHFISSARDMAFSNRGQRGMDSCPSRDLPGRNIQDISAQRFVENYIRAQRQNMDFGYDRGGYDRGRYDRGSYDRGGYNRGDYNRGQWQNQPYSRDYGGRSYYDGRRQPHFSNNQSLDAGTLLRSLIVRGLIDNDFGPSSRFDNRYDRDFNRGNYPGYDRGRGCDQDRGCDPRYRPDSRYGPEARYGPQFQQYDSRFGFDPRRGGNFNRPFDSFNRGGNIGRQIVGRIVVPMVLNEIFNRGSRFQNYRGRRW